MTGLRIQCGPRCLTVLLLASLLLSGCSTSPKANFYTLSATERSDDLCRADGNRVRLQTELLHFPELLSQPQIATRPQHNRIAYAEFHRWAGALESEFSQSLGSNLQNYCNRLQIMQELWPASAAPDYQLYLEVIRFDGKLGDSVTLAVNWVLEGKGQEYVDGAQYTEIVEPIAGKEYLDLVVAQSRAVEALAREIVKMLQL